jgi:CubicO group peptidase (beta-lactamase class C family)
VNRERLGLAIRREELLHGGESWGLVIRQGGRVVREHFTFNVVATTRFDAWSCTKSFTSVAWGTLLGDRPDLGLGLGLRAYEHLPQAAPLTDERKRDITLGHLLGMTSGIPGESVGLIATPPAPDSGPFEHAFGHAPNRYGLDASSLLASPGERWDYSDPAFAHLSPLFTAVAGVSLDTFMADRVFAPLGMDSVSWTQQGGDGHEGPHANAHSGLLLTVHDLARFGQLLLDGGDALVPADWISRSTTATTVNPAYALGWWTNANGAWLPNAPRDLFAALGYRSQRLYVIPSLELVIARLGTGPADWEEGPLLEQIVDAAAA